LKAFIDWGVEILICDESHILKNYKSKRAKNVAKLADKCRHRYLLTGTPILNSSMDLYQQFRILDGYQGAYSTFGNNFFAFRAKYFMDKNIAWAGKPNYYPEWVPKVTAYKELQERISKKTMLAKKLDCLDLPPLVVQTQEVTLGKDQKKAYEEMRKDFITWIKSQRDVNEAVVARLAITKALRLQQICSGFGTTESGESVRFTSVPRLEALRELLETITGQNKVIVWACFKENYKMIAEVCKELGLKYVELHGEQNSKEKQQSVDALNNDPEVRVLIGNQGAGGIGVTLTAATYSIYYSRGFKLGDDLQSEARNHRRGSEVHDKITRINLICPDTIDELVSEALANKLDISDKILKFADKL
jgi:SNF2 family DNA or RNA helicase